MRITTVRPMTALFTATTAVVLGLASAPVADAAPAPATPAAAHTASSGFTTAELLGPFPSDAPSRGSYLTIVDGFTTLRSAHPEIIAQNLDTAAKINNAATKAQQADAIAINYDDRAISLSYALGPTLGAAFRTAWNEGKLPKVTALLKGDAARTSLPLGTTAIEKLYFNNPRPFIVAPNRFHHYDRPGGNTYQVTRDPSYPSGHTTQAYWKGLLLADWLPELGPQILTRSSDIGNARIVLGVHYPLDVIGGRMMGQAIAADRLADPAFNRLVDEAGVQLRTVLEKQTHRSIAASIKADGLGDAVAADAAVFTSRLTYGFPRIAPKTASTIPAESAVLLRAAFPHLTDAQRLEILQQTALPAGYPLDKAGADGGWGRIDLVAALTAHVTIDKAGHAHV
ncbi:hypothetical protein GCM10027169_29760 [Gordonia jinhuaensis]|uniref:Phosphatidic acid phosphatase type 2/haloperoxidase domain-containing protein n=1 Tax=Gordonia jinhuaensis TaxID=1517702 RepID=A0A916T5J4_9ACTN|nr:phosphatase PAP2 family protein [Gordonia jinhuaensis]GGB32696.1 hypothetical protein GCM10011489_21100 [Gordonia jinhuaensis]